MYFTISILVLIKLNNFYTIKIKMDRPEKNNSFGIVQFNGDQFMSWKIRMELLMKLNGLFHIIDEEVPGSPTVKWKSENA